MQPCKSLRCGLFKQMVTVTQGALHANWQRPEPERKQAREETLSHCEPWSILIKAQNKIQSAWIYLFRIVMEYQHWLYCCYDTDSWEG